MAAVPEVPKIASIEDLDVLHQDTQIDALVRFSSLRPDWESRSFQITVPVSVVRNKLMHAVFDWPLVSQVMPATQTLGTVLLQQKINDLQLLSKLTNELKCITLIQQPVFEVQLMVRRSTYNVQMQEDGRILVNQTPCLLIDVIKPCDADADAEDVDVDGAAGPQLNANNSVLAFNFDEAACELKSDQLPWPSKSLLTIVENNADFMETVAAQAAYSPNENEIQVVPSEPQVRGTLLNRMCHTLAQRWRRFLHR